MKTQRVVVGVAVVALVFGLAYVTPSPKNWGLSEEERVMDVRVESLATWHPLAGEWRLAAPTIEQQTSRLFDPRAFLVNLLFLGSDSQPVEFLLSDLSGTTEPRLLVDSTGKGGWFGSEERVGVVFREVHPGDYRLTVRVKDASGSTIIAETTTQVSVGGGRA